MITAQIEHAEQRMRQQWRDLVKAEQEGQPLEVLEQMYDRYILFVEEFNNCSEEYQHQKHNRRAGSSAWRPNSFTGPVLPCQGRPQGTKLAS